MKNLTLLAVSVVLASSALAAGTRSFSGHDSKSDEDVTVTLSFDDSNSLLTFKTETPSGTVAGVPGKAIYDCGTVPQARRYSRAPWGADKGDAQTFNQAAKCWKKRQGVAKMMSDVSESLKTAAR